MYTVKTTKLFDSVTSVSVDAAVAAVSVGSGNTGQTRWFSSNYNGIYPALAIQVVVSGGLGTITYSFDTTLSDLETGIIPTIFSPIADMVSATTSRLDPYFSPTVYSRIRVENATTTGSLTATFLRQGIV